VRSELRLQARTSQHHGCQATTLILAKTPNNLNYGVLSKRLLGR